MQSTETEQTGDDPDPATVAAIPDALKKMEKRAQSSECRGIERGLASGARVRAAPEGRSAGHRAASYRGAPSTQAVTLPAQSRRKAAGTQELDHSLRHTRQATCPAS